MHRGSALALVGAAYLGTTSAQFAVPTFVGCFSSRLPLVSQGYYKYQSSGHCNDICQNQNKTVLGLSGGDTCWCGDETPATNSQVAKSKCNITCQGYNLEDCGGSNSTNTFWTVWLTGLKANVPAYGGAGTGSAASSRTASQASTNTASRSTGSGSAATKTSGTAAASTSSGQGISGAQSGHKHSTHQHGDKIIAIVLGVVLGFIALLIAALLMLWAYRRRKTREQAERPPSSVLFKPESPHDDLDHSDGVQANGTRDEAMAEKQMDSPTLPTVNILGPTPRMSTITNNSMRDASPSSRSYGLPLAAGVGAVAGAGAAGAASGIPARKPVPTQDQTTTTTTTAPTIMTRTVNGGPPTTTIIDHRPSAERNSSNTLALPYAGGGLRAADSFNSQASSSNEPFYTPMEYPSAPNLDTMDFNQPRDRTSMRDSTDGSHYSREEDISALPHTLVLPGQRQERPESFELPIQGAQSRNPPGRTGPGGSYLLPNSSEVRDFDFSDRARS